MNKRAAIGGLLLWLVACFCSMSHAAEPPLVFGVLPRHNATETARMFGPFADYLSRKLGREVKLEMSKDFPSFWKDVTEQRYDIVHYNQMHYIQSHGEFGYEAIVMNEEYGASTIAGAIVVRKDRGIRQLRDLKGKRIIFGGDKTALVSYVLTKKILREAGLRVRDGDYVEEFAKNPPNALLAAYFQQADAAGVGDVAMKLPDVVKQANTSELMILAIGEPIAHLPWAVKKTLAPELRRKIHVVRRPSLNATGLPSPSRVLGHGALFCFAGPGRPAVRQTPPAHNGSTPREARLPGTTRHRFALPGAQRTILEDMKNDAEGRKVLEGANLTGLVAADDADYDLIRKILRQVDAKH